MPASRSIDAVKTVATAPPPGRIRPTAFPLSCAAATGNRGPVRSAIRSSSHRETKLAVSLASETASFVSLWELDRIALRTGPRFPVAAAQLSGNAVGRILPGGGAVATVFTASMLRDAGIDTGEATAAFAATTGLQ